MTFNRRDFLKLTAASAAMASLASCAGANRLGSKSKSIGRVVVVGGGYAGATAAKYLRM